MKFILEFIKNPEKFFESKGFPLEPTIIVPRPNEKVGKNRTTGPGGWREFLFGVGYSKKNN